MINERTNKNNLTLTSHEFFIEIMKKIDKNIKKTQRKVTKNKIKLGLSNLEIRKFLIYMIEDGTKAVIKKSQSILETKAVTNFAIQHDLPQINYDEVYKTHSIFFKKIIKRIKYNPFLDFSNLYAYRLEDASQTLNTYKDRIENYETIDNLYDELIRIERDKKRFSDSDVKEFFELLPLFNIETLIL